MKHRFNCQSPVIVLGNCPLPGWQLLTCSTCGSAALERKAGQ